MEFVEQLEILIRNTSNLVKKYESLNMDKDEDKNQLKRNESEKNQLKRNESFSNNIQRSTKNLINSKNENNVTSKK